MHRGDLPGSRSELLLRAAAGRPIRTSKQRRLPDLSVLCEALASLKLFINQPASCSVCVSVMPPSNVFGVERVKLRALI